MSVVANNREVAGESTGHKIVYMTPSVCLTPAAPSPVPIPYPIMTPAGTGNLDDDARKVKIGGKPLFHVDGIVHNCVGNEPGSQKEVVSHKTSSSAFILDGSPNVKAEGKAVVFTGSKSMGNQA
ncbi:DUF4150 domain-containing protein [Mitsuaria sp. 7]|uniref:DUF4150 domain-containing protein n=1 Tax=Mitsuaria sp. 7 TaxID=1658665 RepID=UPI00082B5B3A|nr:DUF4150 domain-containing protein [Mitsuaria sp. 7]